MTRLTLWLDTALPDDVRAEACIMPGTVIDIGDGIQGLVGRVVRVVVEDDAPEPEEPPHPQEQRR